MENKESKIKLYITTALLTFMGLLSFQMSFLNTFMDSSFYDDILMTFFLLLFSLGFSAVVVFVEKKWIPAVVLLSLLAIWVYAEWDAVIGGLGEVAYSVAKYFGEYYGFENVYLTIAEDKTMYAKPAVFCVVMMGIISYIYALTIHHRKTVIIPILFTAGGLAAPIIIENNPSILVMAYAIAYIVILIIVGSAVKIKNGNGFMVQITAIITGVAIMISAIAVSIVVPESEYVPKNYIYVLRDKFNWLIENAGNRIEGIGNQTSILGGGMLGHVDELKFSDEPVLKVTLPKAEKDVYIKGFVGQNYDSRSWSSAKVQAKSIFNQMYEENYTQHGMVAKYLKNKEATTGIEAGFLGYMKVEKIAGMHLHKFAPLYPVVTSDIADSGDAELVNLDFGTWVQYYSVSYSDFFELAVIEDSKYLTYSNLYENYVYQYYMDVNTPIKNQLKEQWGAYDIETGKDRYELAVAIAEYLDENYEYTLSPGKTPSDRDFVDYFLNESKKGYCTYFATAAVMMFRSAGVPARYVEGYSFSASDGEAAKGDKDVEFYGDVNISMDDYVEVEVLDSDAHAWVEYYVDGIGWIDFEVTGGNSEMNSELMPDIPEETTPEETTPSETDTTPENETTSKEDNTTTADENNTTSADATTSPSEETTGDNGSGKGIDIKSVLKTLKVIGIIFAIIVPITTIVMWLRYRRKKATMEIEQLYSYNGDDRDSIIILAEYERFEKLLKHTGFGKEPHFSEKEYGIYLGNNCPYVGKEEAMAITAMYERMIFSDERLTEDEIAQIKVILNNVRERIYNNKGIFGKFVFVYFLNY